MSIVRRGAERPVDRALKHLSELGIDLPDRPEFEAPKLPRDITAIDDTELMALFGGLTEWMNYISTQAAIAETGEREAEEAKSYDDAAALVNNWGGTSQEKVTIAKAQRDTDPSVVAAKKDLLDKYARRKMVSTLAVNVERRLTVVSREITRRTGGQGAMLQARANKYSR